MKFLMFFATMFIFSISNSTSFVDTLGKKYGKTTGCSSESSVKAKKSTNSPVIESSINKQSYIFKKN
ncbi:MAG: hypothetical protein CMM95_02115 [Rickettsiales bacterium]|nr:hypothetical protein [Rickettsiales bacterium]|tara:strand:- start:370 stop:570 length:201 start_codon:yes stop_codon:yes gene_type:complete